MIATILTMALALILAPPAEAMAPDTGDYSLEVLVDGVPLPVYAARGRTYIEAERGKEYSLRLRNRTGGRIAVALAVDGLNTIDAKTTGAREAAKWILEPHQTLTLDGWQTSSTTARRFFFTTEQESYGAWLGRTRDLGTISAAVFKEKRPKVLIGRDAAGRNRSQSGVPRAGEPRMESAQEGRESGDEARPGRDDYAATGIGTRLDHQVRRVAFDAEERPAAVLTIRYEYRDALVRLGVLPRPERPCEDRLSRRERARGFEEMSFAPDPYGPDCP